MAKWLPPNGFTGRVDRMEARVGSRYHMAFTDFTTGSSHSFGGEYLEPKPNERIRYSDVCLLGWHESLTLLAKLVEAEIPDQAGRSLRRSRRPRSRTNASPTRSGPRPS